MSWFRAVDSEEQPEVTAKFRPVKRLRFVALLLAIIGGVGGTIAIIVAVAFLASSDNYHTSSVYNVMIPYVVLMDIVWALIGAAGGWLGMRKPTAGGILMLFPGILMLMNRVVFPEPEAIVLATGHLVGGSLLIVGGILDLVESWRSVGNTHGSWDSNLESGTQKAAHYCTNCGNRVTDDMVYCVQCGKRIER